MTIKLSENLTLFLPYRDIFVNKISKRYDELKLVTEISPSLINPRKYTYGISDTVPQV